MRGTNRISVPLSAFGVLVGVLRPRRVVPSRSDLAEEANHVSVLYNGRILHHGTTASFLNHTPADVVPGRAAEGAYTALLAQHGSDL
ncbi:hypothetical protein ACFYXM_13430 [Streptomyces sp. NPDC002476]|uniref:hypothetical protein n=1 Tax=Streptomyces sp. NPDC002476 TaxID=3364648 RepID=UPI0036A8AB98